MTQKEYAGWLADKIPAYGDYAKEAAQVLRRQADEIERLQTALRLVIDQATDADLEGALDCGDAETEK